jgi:hypothetical protein
MSKKIKERTKQLASKELALKKKLMGTSGGLKSKAETAGKTALIGGLVALIVFGLYKVFFQSESKSKKSKAVGKSSSAIITEKLMVFLLPYLGKILDDFLRKKLHKSTSDTSDKKEEGKGEE